MTANLKSVTPKKEPGIDHALLQARADLVSLAPDKENTFTKVKYVSAEKTIREAKAALGNAGLVARPIDNYVEYVEGLPFHVTIYKLSHADSGESEIINFRLAMKGDTKMGADKTHLANMTSSWSYFLRDLLMLARDEDEIQGAPDNSKSSDPFTIKSRSGNFDPANEGMRETFRMHCNSLGVSDDQSYRKGLAGKLHGEPMRLLKQKIEALIKA